jgi:ribosomal-protein-alanine N-acetyltransferase
MELALMQAVIRSWRAQDTNALVRHANNHRVCRNLRDRFPHPYTAADAERWIRTATEAVSSGSKELAPTSGGVARSERS